MPTVLNYKYRVYLRSLWVIDQHVLIPGLSMFSNWIKIHWQWAGKCVVFGRLGGLGAVLTVLSYPLSADLWTSPLTGIPPVLSFVLGKGTRQILTKSIVFSRLDPVGLKRWIDCLRKQTVAVFESLVQSSPGWTSKWSSCFSHQVFEDAPPFNREWILSVTSPSSIVQLGGREAGVLCW